VERASSGPHHARGRIRVAGPREPAHSAPRPVPPRPVLRPTSHARRQGGGSSLGGTAGRLARIGHAGPGGDAARLPQIVPVRLPGASDPRYRGPTFDPVRLGRVPGRLGVRWWLDLAFVLARRLRVKRPPTAAAA